MFSVEVLPSNFFSYRDMLQFAEVCSNLVFVVKLNILRIKLENCHHGYVLFIDFYHTCLPGES